MNTSYIYTLTCPLTSKIYIGYTNIPNRREYEHQRLLDKNIHYNKYLQRHYNKYLKSTNAKFELNIIDKTSTSEIATLENLWVEELSNYNKVFNLTKGGEDLANLSPESLEKRHQTIINLVGKPVYCYTVTGEYIGKFRCASEVADKLNLNLNSVQNAIRRGIKLKNYVFFRELQENYKEYHSSPNHTDKVLVLDIRNNSYNIYESMINCSIDLNINYNTLSSRIRRCSIISNQYAFITKDKIQDWMDKLKAFGTDKIALRLLDNEMGG